MPWRGMIRSLFFALCLLGVCPSSQARPSCDKALETPILKLNKDAIAEIEKLDKGDTIDVALETYDGSQPVQRYLSGTEIYILVKKRTKVVMLTMPQLTSDGRIITHKHLIRSYLRGENLFRSRKLSYKGIKFIGAGEIKYKKSGRDTVISEINNRSGTLLPNSIHLSRAVDFVNRSNDSKVPKSIIVDYAKADKKHPDYIPNKFFDTLHTINYVQAIGKAKFKTIVKSSKTANEATQKINDASIKSKNGESKAKKDDGPWSLKKLKEQAEKNQSNIVRDKSINAEDVLADLNQLHKDGVLFRSVNEYMSKFSGKVRKDHRFELSITYVEVFFNLVLDGASYPVKFVLADSSVIPEYRNLIKQNNVETGEYHNSILTKASEVVSKEFSAILLDNGSISRMGIITRKEKGQSKFFYWALPKTDYRAVRTRANQAQEIAIK